MALSSRNHNCVATKSSPQSFVFGKAGEFVEEEEAFEREPHCQAFCRSRPRQKPSRSVAAQALNSSFGRGINGLRRYDLL
jgi:hypothetical protein